MVVSVRRWRRRHRLLVRLSQGTDYLTSYLPRVNQKSSTCLTWTRLTASRYGVSHLRVHLTPVLLDLICSNFSKTVQIPAIFLASSVIFFVFKKLRRRLKTTVSTLFTCTLLCISVICCQMVSAVHLSVTSRYCCQNSLTYRRHSFTTWQPQFSVTNAHCETLMSLLGVILCFVNCLLMYMCLCRKVSSWLIGVTWTTTGHFQSGRLTHSDCYRSTRHLNRTDDYCTVPSALYDNLSPCVSDCVSVCGLLVCVVWRLTLSDCYRSTRHLNRTDDYCTVPSALYDNQSLTVYLYGLLKLYIIAQDFRLFRCTV